MKLVPALLIGFLLGCPHTSQAGCCEHHEPAEAFQHADAVGEYRITSSETFEDDAGRLHTRHSATLNQTFKGDTPPELEFKTPGGCRGHLVELSSLTPNFKVGQECVFHLRREVDGSWTPLPFQTIHCRGGNPERQALRDYFHQGARGRFPATPRSARVDQGTDQGTAGIPGSVVTPTGYMETSGLPTRFTRCDGGESIPCLVDIDPGKLPTGMDVAGALAAVEEAFHAWSSVSSLRFRIEGITSFGTAANLVAKNDGHIRIQLHDTYNVVDSGVLGIGGGSFTTSSTVPQGGAVAGQAFQERLRGYVVLNHRPASMRNAVNFKQVLTHELGHALGLAHSSENPSEPDPVLRNATMYYATSNDGRGAALSEYDEDRIVFGYPRENTPPYALDRMVTAISRSGGGSLPAAPGVNRFRLQALDLQNSAISPTLLTGSSDRFSVVGQELIFDAPDYTSAPRLTVSQIDAGSYYYQAYVQFSDGVNQSRVTKIRVVELATDSAPSDGLPNTWMTNHFGTISPGLPGSPSHPDSDPDGDGLSNRLEFLLGTDPKSPTSGPAILSYDHKTRTLTLKGAPYAAYRIESAPSPAGPWIPRRLVSDITGTMISDLWPDPAPDREFYRVITEP